MRKFLIAFAASAAVLGSMGAGVGSSGCSSPFFQKATSNEAGVLDGQVIDEKVMIGLHASVYGAAVAASEATKTVPPLIVKGSPEAQKVKTILQSAEKALALADAAYEAGDADTLRARISEVQGLVAQAWSLSSQK